MIVSIGTDMIEIARIEQVLAKRGGSFGRRVFTAAERLYCESRARPAESFAARFAAKEAVLKCLGTGWAQGIGFREIEVTRDAGGEVGVELSGAAAARAADRGIRRILLSLSHSTTLALAYAVATG